jgi:hypothetical protein
MCPGVHVPTRVYVVAPAVITLNLGPEILRYGAAALAFSEPRTNGKDKMSRYFWMCFTAVTVEANNPFITNKKLAIIQISCFEIKNICLFIITI